MFAKSTPFLGSSLNLRKVAHWMRGLVSVLVLAASLMALVLIVNNQYGPVWLGDTLRALPLERLAPPATAAQKGGEAVVISLAEESRHRTIAEFLAKRYRVSQDVTLDLVGVAHNTGRQMGLDPLLIIAVIAVESRFNPIAESVAGAKGLMQIIPRYHAEKLEQHGGDRAVFDPVINILVGSQILKEYLRLTGHLGMALQMYAGAVNDMEDQYTNKVLSEKRRLQQVLAQSPEQRPTATKTATIRPVPAAPVN